MTKTMVIEGMMCPHCEAKVKKALEAIPGVKSAEPSRESGTAIVICDESVSNDVLRAAVTTINFDVKGIN